MSELARVEAEHRGNLCVIHLHGEVDISHTTYLDSAGLALLLRLAERLQARRQQMRIVAPLGSPVRTVLELTGLPRVIPLEGRLENAVRASEEEEGRQESS